MDELTPLGFYNFRNQQKKFGIRVDDRRRHIYVVGKTGVGKSTLLENMIIADIRSGKGVGVVDPHGELAEKILDFVPEERLQDVIYFDPSDMEYPIAFNPMEQVGNEFRHLVASGIMGVFKKIWPDAWSARMEYILNNTLLALLELPDATLLGILRMFAEPEYRKKIVDNLKDPVIKAFWANEFARYSQKLETEALAAIQNKVGQFVSNPLIRNILGQPRSALNMRQIMDTGKIFIVNLSKGKIGEDNSALLGAMIITRLNLAAMSRVDIPEKDRRDFFLYVDEFQNFATDSFANILSEARKYHLSLTLAHQYIGQLMTSDSTKVRDAIFGNVGTIITFRVGAEDGEFLEKEFMPEFLQTDLVNLAKANIYVKLMIDGVASRPFSAETVPPERTPLVSYRDVIIKNSREKYGTPKSIVEARIAGEWLAKSDSAINEKMDRRDERHLSEVLRPGANDRRPPGRTGDSGRPQGSSFGSPSSFSGGTPQRSGPSAGTGLASAARPPRRMLDVERQDGTGGRSGDPKPAVRPTQVPVGQSGHSSLVAKQEPVTVRAEVQVERHPEEDVKQVLAPPAGAPQKNMASEHDDVAEESAPDMVPERKNPKINVDIDALRRAINESLAKQSVGRPEHGSRPADVPGAKEQPASFRTDGSSGSTKGGSVTRAESPGASDRGSSSGVVSSTQKSVSSQRFEEECPIEHGYPGHAGRHQGRTRETIGRSKACRGNEKRTGCRNQRIGSAVNRPNFQLT